MGKSIAHLVLRLTPVVGKLDYGVIMLIAIADKRQREFTVGIIMLAHQLHSERVAIKLQAFVEVVDAIQLVQKAHALSSWCFKAGFAKGYLSPLQSAARSRSSNLPVQFPVTLA